MPKASDHSADHGALLRVGAVRRRRVLVVAMLAALLGAVVLGRE